MTNKCVIVYDGPSPKTNCVKKKPMNGKKKKMKCFLLFPCFPCFLVIDKKKKI